MIKYLITVEEAVSITSKTSLKGKDSTMLGNVVAYKCKQPGKRGRDQNLYAVNYNDLQNIHSTTRGSKKNELEIVNGTILPQLRLIKGEGNYFQPHYIYDSETHAVYKYASNGDFWVDSQLSAIKPYNGTVTDNCFVRLTKVPRGIVQLKSDRDTDVNYALKRDQMTASKLRKKEKTVENISKLIKTNSLSASEEKNLYEMIEERQKQLEEQKPDTEKVGDYILELIPQIQKVVEDDLLTQATFKEFKFNGRTLKFSISIE